MKLNIQAMRKIGLRIRHKRMLLRLTQEDLAEKAGYTTGYLGSVENARRVPSMSFLFDIATALETSPSALLIDAQGGPDREQVKQKIKALIEFL